MLSWLVKKILTHNLTRLNAGDYRPALRLDAKDVIWGRLGRGLLREYEVYEDTQKTKALDDHLTAAHAAPPMAS